MDAKPLLLVVDDEVGLLRLIKLELSAQGYKVITALNASEAEDMIREFRPDLILLDILMPGKSGLQLMAEIRETSTIPIILVTARDREIDRIRGLELGADDYVVKPFNPDELGARVRALLRRVEWDKQGQLGAEDVMLVIGDLQINTRSFEVSYAGSPVKLSKTDTRLLMAFVRAHDQLLLSAELLTKIWGPEYRDDFKYLSNRIGALRRRLRDKERKVIVTSPGVGYILKTR